LSFLACGDFTCDVQGINNLQAQYEQTYGPGWYTPNIPITYWGFRLMIGLGMIAVLFGMWALWATRRERAPTGRAGRWFLRAAIVMPFLPLLGMSAGWIFTEMGRQPWIVFGLMETSKGVSPGVGMGEVIASLGVFALLYGALAVVEFTLLIRTIKQGPPEDLPVDPYERADEQDKPLTFAY